MIEKKISWDDIPSLNLEIDHEYDQKLKQTVDARRNHRADIKALKQLLNEKISYLPVRVSTMHKGMFDGKIIDLSKSGAQLSLPKALDKGEPVKIGFILNDRSIITKAMARWVKAGEKAEHLIGVEFQGLSAGDIEHINSIISADLFSTIGRFKL